MNKSFHYIRADIREAKTKNGRLHQRQCFCTSTMALYEC